jgi:hypothetical protein
MTELDRKVLSWFKIELNFLILATFAYSLGATLLAMNGRLINKMGTFISTGIILIKVFYYIWATVGAYLYFVEVR